MTTPNRNNFENYCSPYTSSTQQIYPSQSEDYLSLNSGGSSYDLHTRTHRHHTQRDERFTSTPAKLNQNNADFGASYFYQKKQTLQENGGHGAQHNRFYSHKPYSINCSNANANGGMQQYRHNHHQNFQGRHSNDNGTNKTNEYCAADYVHVSMMEDPWKDLLARQNALRNSTITINYDVNKATLATM